MIDEAELLSELIARFTPVAVVLYGSAATGAVTATSDLDLLCFVERQERYPELGTWRGHLLDVWIHPIADCADDSQFLRLHDGRVLLDRDGLAADLLARVRARLAAPLPPLDLQHARHLRGWLWKMFDRAVRGGTDGDHRRHWLLHELPQVWCELTGRHHLGFARTMQQLRLESVAAHETITAALRPGATISDIEAAVRAIAGPRAV